LDVLSFRNRKTNDKKTYYKKDREMKFSPNKNLWGYKFHLSMIYNSNFSPEDKSIP